MAILAPKRQRLLPQRLTITKRKCNVGIALVIGFVGCVFAIHLSAMSVYQNQQPNLRQNVYPHQRVYPKQNVYPKVKYNGQSNVMSRPDFAAIAKARDAAQAMVPLVPSEQQLVVTAASKVATEAIVAPATTNQVVLVDPQAPEIDPISGLPMVKIKRQGKYNGRQSMVIKALFAADPPMSQPEQPSALGNEVQQPRDAAPPLPTKVKPEPSLTQGPKFVMSTVRNNALDHRKEKVFKQLLTPMYNIADVQKMIKLVEEQDPNNKYALCQENNCDTVNDSIRAFNPWERDLYLCGEMIEAQSSIEIIKPCHENTRVYQEEPENTGVTKMCLDPSRRQVVYPFVETIIEMHPSGQNYNVTLAKSGCREKFKAPVVKTLGSWHRTVWHHDGVVDITLEGRSSDTYQVLTGMNVKGEKLREHVYEMRDDTFRVVVIVDPRIFVTNMEPGIFSFRTSHQSIEPKRIRVIVEDPNEPTVEDGEMSHTETMLNEFISPVQFFKVVH
jgi:hypothetical protein